MDFTHILSIVVVISVSARAQQFTSTPQNQAVLKTIEPTFSCSSDQDALYMNWQEKKTEASIFSTLTAGGDLLPNRVIEGYVLDKSNDKYDLTPPVDDLPWAGDYRCQVVYPATIEASAKLIVLESDPTCTSNVTGAVVEGEVVSYTCDVAYRGDLYPKMQWSTNPRSIDDTIDESVDGERTKVSITVTAAVANNGWTYKCDTYFDAPTNSDPGYATNAPDYESGYESLPLEVHWSPRNVQITPQNEQFYPGEVLTCAGDSNPAIDYYIWQDVTNGTVVLQQGDDAQSLVILEEWIAEDLTFRCIVQNTRRDGIQTGEVNITFGIFTTTVPPTTEPTTTSETTTLEPVPGTTDPNKGKPDSPKDQNVTGGGSTNNGAPALSTGAIVGIALAVVGVIIIVLLVLYCFCFKRNSTKEDEANNTRPQKPVPHDQVRTMKNDLSPAPTPGPYDSNPPPPPYNNPYDPEDPYGRHPQQQHDPRARNVEGLVYADLALDDTPRSRKPIQFGTDPNVDVVDSTLYADVRPGPMV